LQSNFQPVAGMGSRIRCSPAIPVEDCRSVSISLLKSTTILMLSAVNQTEFPGRTAWPVLKTLTGRKTRKKAGYRNRRLFPGFVPCSGAVVEPLQGQKCVVGHVDNAVGVEIRGRFKWDEYVCLARGGEVCDLAARQRVVVECKFVDSA